ncbi:MAG: lipid-A-disaccharide synthase [Methylomonas sp.]|nr:MAG: lipid-A-disaccharide synthase [Methylobacter sp.]PPD37473.1 MAG: lipid-A-disaccharide synthase [Methylomonas sp.]
MSDQALKIMFSAGESSGDRHAANMFLELKQSLPNIQGMGMGSTKMAEAGIKLTYDSTAIAVIGIVEVIKHYPEIKRALKLMQNTLIREKPDLLVCVDYKEFNYNLARFAKRHGIKVLFYVSPQIWAWREGRVKQYGKAVDMMAVIFPFETRYYEAEGIPVRYVGHPSVDKAITKLTKSDALQQFGLSGQQSVVGILPGSRPNEIKRLLPVMLNAAEAIRQKLPSVQFILPQADSIADSLIQTYLNKSACHITVVKHQPYDVMQCCDAIITTSGTATLEIALFTVPMVIAYKLSPITYLLGRLLVKTPFIGLPNIIAGKAIVKELIQHHANAQAMAAEILHILENPDYAKTMRQNLLQVKLALGEGGGSKNIARLALEMLA